MMFEVPTTMDEIVLPLTVGDSAAIEAELAVAVAAEREAFRALRVARARIVDLQDEIEVRSRVLN